jgi:hypothetical protein
MRVTGRVLLTYRADTLPPEGNPPLVLTSGSLCLQPGPTHGWLSGVIQPPSALDRCTHTSWGLHTPNQLACGWSTPVWITPAARRPNHSRCRWGGD